MEFTVNLNFRAWATSQIWSQCQVRSMFIRYNYSQRNLFLALLIFRICCLVLIRAKDSVINYSLRIIRGIEDYVPLSLYLPGDEEYVLFCILVCMQCVPKHLSPGVLLLPTLGSIRFCFSKLLSYTFHLYLFLTVCKPKGGGEHYYIKSK